jgi:D-arabinose 1-dehydrogenase-like Zn-dependent alcohol dehydrogenase
MRAAVLPAHGELLDLELATPPLGPHDVRLRIDASGVCHTDLAFLMGVAPFRPR